MFYTALISSRHCNNEANILKNLELLTFTRIVCFYYSSNHFHGIQSVKQIRRKYTRHADRVFSSSFAESVFLLNPFWLIGPVCVAQDINFP